VLDSVVLLGFSAAVASRIIDSECKMVITSDGGYRGNKTIALKEIDEALESASIEKVWLLKNKHSDKRGQRYLVATLTRWSFRQQCCRNNGFRILYSFYIPPVRQEKKEWFTPPLVMVYTAYTFKMFSIMKKTISFGVRLILVGLQVTYILYGPFERSNNSDFEGYLRILILVVLGNYRET
jgi:acetyl-CoA synthetase